MAHEDRLKHAKGLVNYYSSMIWSNSGTPQWREGGLNAAERYLSFAESEETSLEDLKDFMKYLKDNQEIYSGTGWLIL